jgi:hypothetical protein
MIEILENIYSFFAKLLPYSFGIAIIGFFISYAAMLFKKKNITRIIIILVAQVFVIGAIMVSLQTIIIIKIRNEILQILSDPETQFVTSTNDFKILPSELKHELLKIQDIPTNHTGPQKQNPLEVITKNSIFKIFIAQDSGNKNQFWIFTDKYNFSRSMEIGKVNSALIK